MDKIGKMDKMDKIKASSLRYFYKPVSKPVNLQIQKQEALFYILKTGIGKGDVQNIFCPCCTLLIQSKLLVNVIFAKLGDQVKP